MHSYSSVIFCKVLSWSSSILFNIHKRMSLSRLADNPWTKTKHLNMPMDKSSKLNIPHCWFTLPTKQTKYLSSYFLKFKHLYLVWNKLFLLTKILDKNFIVSSNEISSGFVLFCFCCKIKFVYFVYSSVPSFWSKKVTFCSSDQEEQKMSRTFDKMLEMLFFWAILEYRNWINDSFCCSKKKKLEFLLFAIVLF